MSEKQAFPGETWRFTVRPGRAQRVYLVIDGKTLPSRWVEMQPVTGMAGLWDVKTHLPTGDFRFRYFIAHEGTYLNCGTSGLFGERLDAADASVKVQPLTQEVASA